ncbi:hypothetical protein GIB67_001661 [Kingdonia uniflora]|uniref:Uncharacterized protein n=1 Tax=Kingdonia uniflora TaxID=39325 RepID=A0A7J7L113_9MAGN|nr:hypothetical protein GIB67_001661 [Kingdonia uniflora]
MMGHGGGSNLSPLAPPFTALSLSLSKPSYPPFEFTPNSTSSDWHLDSPSNSNYYYADYPYSSSTKTQPYYPLSSANHTHVDAPCKTQGAPAANGLVTHGEGSSVSPQGPKESSVRDGPVCMDWMVFESVPKENARVSPFNFSRPQALGPSDAHVQPLEPLIKSWDTPAFGKCVTQHDSYISTTDSVTFYPSKTYSPSFPTMVSPAIEFSSPASKKKTISVNVNGGSKLHEKDPVARAPFISNFKDLHIQVRAEGKEGYDSRTALRSHEYLVDNRSIWVEDSPSLPKRISPKGSTISGVECSDGIRESAKESSIPHNSACSPELKYSQVVHIRCDEDKISSEKEVAPEGIGADQMNAIQVGSFCALFNSKKLVSSSPPSGVGKHNEPAESLSGASHSRVVINSMISLSELLLSTCSKDAWSEQEHDVVQQVINNLDACVLKKGAKVEAYNVKAQSDNQIGHDHRKNSTISGTKEDEFQNLTLLRDGTNIGKDDKVTKDIKKVLEENFENEEGAHPQIQLYKELWLEAEAELCSMKYKSRFARLKIEMDRSNVWNEKELEGTSNGVEKLPIPKVSAGVNKDNCIQELKIKENTSNITTFNKNPSSLSDAENESSVMARLRILKCRVDNSSSTNKEEQTLPNSVETNGRIEDKRMRPIWERSGMMKIGLKEVVKADMRNPSLLIGDGLEDPHIVDVRQQSAICGSMKSIGQPYMQATKFGNWIPGSGSSSDWEHVLKEDIMWQN